MCWSCKRYYHAIDARVLPAANTAVTHASDDAFECTRCGRGEGDCRENGCLFGPCPMALRTTDGEDASGRVA